MARLSVDAQTLKTWLDNDEAILVDVREPAEYQQASIKGSILMPLGRVDISLLPNNTNKKLVIHCARGMRGGSACEKLLSQDDDLVLYNLEGGINAWMAQGYEVNASNTTCAQSSNACCPPVSISTQSCLPLDRQVQLTIGIGVVLGVLLGALVSSYFYGLSLFFGLGLIYAGLSGTCRLAMILSKMPWNNRK